VLRDGDGASGAQIRQAQHSDAEAEEAPLGQAVLPALLCRRVLLAVSLYGLYAFNGQKALLAQRVLDGQGLDPLLFLSSSLFIIGAGLVALSLFPQSCGLSTGWKAGLEAPALRLLPLGAQDAEQPGLHMRLPRDNPRHRRFQRPDGQDDQHKRRKPGDIQSGADLVVQEVWEDNRDEIDTVEELDTVPLVYTEPNYGKYQELEGAESVTKVLYDTAAHCSCGKNNAYVPITLMGINTKEFGRTVEFKDGLLPLHWYEYLNAMSRNPLAALVSANMRDNLGLALGDTIATGTGTAIPPEASYTALWITGRPTAPRP
jgi:putative ABC transport system permease protein